MAFVPDHRFGFRRKHSTADQVHRVTNVIGKAKEKNYRTCSIPADVVQKFDGVLLINVTNMKTTRAAPAHAARTPKIISD